MLGDAVTDTAAHPGERAPLDGSRHPLTRPEVDTGSLLY
jgi:hypothetical protein